MFFRGILLFFLLCSPLILAQRVEESSEPTEATINDDEEDVVVDDTVTDEAEEEKMKDKLVTDIVHNEGEPEEPSIVDGVPVGSKKVSTELLFVLPASIKKGSTVELPANRPVKLLVSFSNLEEPQEAGEGLYRLEYVEGFLRYPSDYSYYLQNFTRRQLQELEVVVEPGREASVEYGFVPALQLAGRPFGLTLRLGYKDGKGKMYTSTFFNDTIQIIELEEGFDTESLFLYVLVAAVLGLVLFGVYHLFTVYALKKFKKSGVSKPAVAETTVNSDIDLQWIPAEHLKIRQSPTMSPRKRKSRRNDDNHTTGGH